MSAPITGRTARIVFLAITSGAVLMTGVLVALRQPPVEGDLSLKPFSYLAPLFAAAAAGLSLTLRQRPTVRRQRIAEQVHRRQEATVELRKVETGSGV